jgi:hypothetical protein
VTNQPPSPSQALLEQLAELVAEALAPKIAAQLTARQPEAAQELPSKRLLTLDQLVALLPTGKKPETWKRWLYERTRRGLVPGCHKLGRTLFFDPQETLPWLTGEPAPDQDWMSARTDGTVEQMPGQTTAKARW